MDLESDSELPSAPPSTFEVPSELQNAFDFNSRAIEADPLRDAVPDEDDDKYKGLNWLLFPGFQIPPPSKRDRRSHIWKDCYEVYRTATEHHYAVCKICHQRKQIKYGTNHRWLDSSTGRAAEHLAKEHRIGSNGPIEEPEGARSLLNMLSRTPAQQAAINQRRLGFDGKRFKKLLT